MNRSVFQDVAPHVSWLPALLLALGSLCGTVPAAAQTNEPTPELKGDRPQSRPKAAKTAIEIHSSKSESTPEKNGSSESDDTSFDELIADFDRIDGLFPLYHDEETGKLYLELDPSQLDRTYLLIATLSQGIGDLRLIEGLPLRDFPVVLRRQNDSVLVVVPNTSFRTEPGDPQSRSVDRAFTESVLAALSIEATHPERNTLLVDAEELLVGSDLSGIVSAMSGLSYSLQSDRSYIADARGFPQNLEIDTRLGFSGSIGGGFLQAIPDDRAFSLGVRYSLSPLPQNNGYRPRRADNRVGYFVTAYRNLSDTTSPDPFVRYVQRWHLEKQDPTAELSPPVEPIVFWIENTVPEVYRDAIREGVLMWNRAFERAGYLNAIEVRQMPDEATWDPADVRYNTIRWATSFRTGFAGIGPSRVNPLTGEILDADILISANIVRILERESEVLQGGRSQRLFVDLPGDCQTRSCEIEAQPSPLEELRSRANFGSDIADRFAASQTGGFGDRLSCNCFACQQVFREGALALSLLGDPASDEDVQRYTEQYLKFLVAHEVGHTLGLRHNFHGSTLRSPEELHDLELTRSQGLSGSVMDYLPPNIAPPGTEQGDFFPVVVGPYDEWAIAYGYTSFDDLAPDAERRQLDEIASQSPQPELAYGTDEDLRSEIDPAVNWFDLSNDMLAYSQTQMDLADLMWDRLQHSVPASREFPEEARVRFDYVLNYYFRQARVLLKHIGGQSFSRDRGLEPPFDPLPAEVQRQSLRLLQDYIFADDAFEFPPELLNQLAPSRWLHWGSVPPTARVDYPIHARIFGMQQQVLRSLLSRERLARLRDLELKTPPGEALALPELFDSVYQSIWSEVLQGRRVATNISSIRRTLQREHLNLSIDMALGRSDVPEDARTLARLYLTQLDTAIERVRDRHDDDLDTYTRAHLEDTQVRVRQALDAQVISN